MNSEKYVLVKMSGMIRGSETYGDDMVWQERIVLMDEKRFEKIRMMNGEETIASGTYEYKELKDGRYLELNYRAESDLIGNCDGSLKELYRTREGQLFGTWQACDGPGLEYEKSE